MFNDIIDSHEISLNLIREESMSSSDENVTKKGHSSLTYR